MQQLKFLHKISMNTEIKIIILKYYIFCQNIMSYNKEVCIKYSNYYLKRKIILFFVKNCAS